MNISEILLTGPVMPVIVIDDADLAVPLGEALLSGGINAIEVTLRTDAALNSIERLAK
jgi:2-dehydro-3-deoxyphosphogluconate aldolase/(4S)-4-hydroxy-2-oxoglutarate aldolase